MKESSEAGLTKSKSMRRRSLIILIVRTTKKQGCGKKFFQTFGLFLLGAKQGDSAVFWGLRCFRTTEDFFYENNFLFRQVIEDNQGRG